MVSSGIGSMELNNGSGVFDLINKVIAYGDSNISVVMCGDEPWFKGNDVASILGYKRAIKSVIDHVDLSDRMPLKSLCERVVLKQEHLVEYDENQLKTTYINESGLYSLILSSKLSAAKQFKKWVTGEMLPSIRKLGQEKYMRILEEKESMLLESRAHLEQKNKEIEELKKRQLVLTGHIQNQTLYENQIAYLATTKSLARQNRYEFGGVRSGSLLSKRMNEYNVGRPEGDLMYVVRVRRCNNYRVIEEEMHSVLYNYKDKLGGRKEMVCMKYKRLAAMFDEICGDYSTKISSMNTHNQEIYEESLGCETDIPGPVDESEYLEADPRRIKYNLAKEDAAEWPDEKLDSSIEEVVDRVVSDVLGRPYSFRNDSDRVTVVVPWGLIVEQLLKLSRIRRKCWRHLFKKWYDKHSPTLMLIKGFVI